MHSHYTFFLNKHQVNFAQPQLFIHLFIHSVFIYSRNINLKIYKTEKVVKRNKPIKSNNIFLSFNLNTPNDYGLKMPIWYIDLFSKTF